ncbi:MAG: class I SAM-dependent methyltransferase [Acidobacteriota bacterium]|jgi:SAM-dependent methyltransferase|nr:class I SAM-dependent methyltransferase [Acidobacteriota bacterium]
MKRSRFVFLLAVAACLSLAAAGALAQEQGREYVPSVGQAGKDVVWVPTPQDLVDAMLDMAEVTAADYVIDLGSGDGRTVITAAKRGATAMGIEYNPDMVELAERNAAKAGVSDKATFVKADLFESDFSRATVITMFLLPRINLELRPKILDMKPGTRVVSNSFDMELWKADQATTLTEDCAGWCTAYLWIVPAKVDGEWKLDGGALSLRQTFQEVTGKITVGGKTSDLVGKLDGDVIRFEAGGEEFTGKVVGGAISGTRARGGSWRATR